MEVPPVQDQFYSKACWGGERLCKIQEPKERLTCNSAYLLTLSSVRPRDMLYVVIRWAHRGIEVEFQLREHMKLV